MSEILNCDAYNCDHVENVGKIIADMVGGRGILELGAIQFTRKISHTILHFTLEPPDQPCIKALPTHTAPRGTTQFKERHNG